MNEHENSVPPEEIPETPVTEEGFAEEALAGNLEDQPEITLEDLPL